MLSDRDAPALRRLWPVLLVLLVLALAVRPVQRRPPLALLRHMSDVLSDGLVVGVGEVGQGGAHAQHGDG